MYRKMPSSKDDYEFEEPTINLTALIDVVFVLLISFMILAPLLNVEHVDLAKSGNGPIKEAKNSALSIFIKDDDSLIFEGKTVTLVQLEVVLKKRFSESKVNSPQVFADKKCHFGLFQEVKNMLEEVGFSEMDVVLK